MSANRAHPSDPQFLRCAQAFEAECDYVHRALRRHGVRRQDAADLVQDVFLVMWRRWGEFDATRELRPWLAGIAFKVAHGHHRRFARKELPTDELDPATDGPGPDEELAHARARELVLAALGQLPEMYRSVLVMHDLDGIPVRDIAAVAELPRFTVHTRLRRARLNFEKTLRALETEPRYRRALALALAPAALLALERASTAAPAPTGVRLHWRSGLQRLDPPTTGSSGPWWLALGGVAIVATVALIAPRSPRPHRVAARAAIAAQARAALPRLVTPRVPVQPAPAPARAPVAAAGPGLDAGLVGHWTFDEAPGSAVAHDRSGRGNDCVLHGREPALAWRGGTAQLGPHGWLECAQPATVVRWPAATSVAFWVKPHHLGPATTLLDRAFTAPVTAPSDPRGKSFLHLSLRGNTVHLWSGTWSKTTLHELESAPSGWIHLAVTHRALTTKLFIDGTLVAQRDDGHLKDAGGVTTAPLIVGALVKDPTRVWQHLDGAIADLRVYDRALADDDLATLAARRPAP